LLLIILTDGFLIKNKDVLVKPKILIADDSLTIQKVIKITLANEDYDLAECLDDKNLLEKISEEKPTVVLLDFNLSESKVGYDIVKEIQNISSAKIMMMYGTFDTVDESLLSNLGIDEHLVKPFDGNKFIASCRRMVEDSELIEESSFEMSSEFPEPISAEEVEPEQQPQEMSRNIFDDDEDDQWVVNQPEVATEEVIAPSEIISSAEMNQLEAGIQDWGMDVPSIIGQSEPASVELPPIIESLEASPEMPSVIEKEIEPEVITEVKLDTAPVEDENILPASTDLEYPDMDTIRSSVEKSGPSIELTPIDDLSSIDLEDNSVEPTQGEGTNTEEEIRHLEEQIADELDDDNEEDLWAADEFVVENPAAIDTDDNVEEESISDFKIDEVKETLEEFQAESSQDDIEPVTTATSTPISADQFSELESRIKEMLTPMIEEMVKAQIQKSIDKVAWEVIPDLAENLIKKELKTISDQILDS
jgi:DNA-binding response OmpR family regulator